MRRTVIAALAAALLVPATASAGRYDVVACNAPGAGGVNHSWTGTATSFNAAPQPEVYDIFDDCRGAERGLVARTHVGGSDLARFLTGAAWIFDAPAGTTISRVTVWRYGFKFRTGEGADGDPWFMGAQEANGNTVGGGFGETCENPEGQPLCSIGADGGASAANEKTYDVATTKLSWQIHCRVLSGCGRYYAGIPTASMELYGARVRLTDNSAPALTTGGPALEAGWRRPGDAIVYSASDNSGIRSARVESGGLASRASLSCDYTYTVPCSNVRGGRLRLPALPDGAHAVRVVAEDAAGNPRTREHLVQVDGTPPQARLEPPRGRTLRVRVGDALSGVATGTILVRQSPQEAYRPLETTLKGGVLRARLDRGALRRTDVHASVTDSAGNHVEGSPVRIRITGGRKRVRFGRRAVLRGRLTLSGGLPVAGGRVHATGRIRRAGAATEDFGTVTADRRGRFRVAVPAGPSRAVTLAFAGGGGLLGGARRYGVRVPAATTIRASKRVLPGPGRVRFSGRVRTLGQPIPARGLVVVLQGRDNKRWRTFADARANRRGRWRTSYRFHGVPGRYPIRARVRRQAGFPFALGHSRRVTVRVR
jgi:hypothetical protein